MNATDSLRLSCPKCAATVRAAAALAGKRVKCPKCGGAIKVPGATQSSGDDDDWLSLDDPLPQPTAGRQTPAASSATAGSSSQASPKGEEDWFDDLPSLASSPTTNGSGGTAGGTAGARSLTPAEEAALAAAGGFDWDDDDFGDPSSPAGRSTPGHRKPAPLKPEQQIREPIRATPATPASPSGATAGAGNPPTGAAAPTSRPPTSRPPTSRPPISGSPNSRGPSSGGPGAGSAGQASPPRGGGAAPPSEYRAKCPVCGSVLFVRPQQAGRSVRCSDCHSDFVVPPPPLAPAAKPKVDLDRVEAFQLSEAAGEREPSSAPGFRSAADYLRAAEDAEIEEERANEYDNPDMVGWLRGIFAIFSDPSVAAYWLMLSLLGALPGMLAVAIGHPVVLLISLALIVVYGSLVVACGFAILETVAGGERRVDEWPVFNPAEWIGQALTAIAAIALSGIPGALLGYPMFGPHLGSVALVMFSVYLLFPYVLLSMLDNGSPFMPVSGEVTKSVTRCKDAWGSLYFSSMLLFFFQFIATAVLSLMPVLAAVFFNCLLWVGLVFVYFAMIGRLAFEIGQPIKEETDEE